MRKNKLIIYDVDGNVIQTIENAWFIVKDINLIWVETFDSTVYRVELTGGKTYEVIHEVFGKL